MDNTDDLKDETLRKDLQALALLHPTYTDLELREAHARLYRYFDLVWGMLVRLEDEGKIGELNLTGSMVNLKVNADAEPSASDNPPQP